MLVRSLAVLVMWLVGTACGYDPSQENGSSPTPTSAPGNDDSAETPTPMMGTPGCEDGDADGACEEVDCNDRDPSVYPNAEEICDNKDNDCDGVEDIDEDGDGYVSEDACPRRGDDCDDTDPDINPGEREVCNFVDDDCNGLEDDGVEPQTWYRDNDGDGVGNIAPTQVACEKQSGWSDSDDDCNDSDETIYPGAAESCNTLDDDCDGQVDEGVKTTYYPDDDRDGFGDPDGPTKSSCAVPANHVADSSDCDDSSPDVNPDAQESCDLIDNDCDGAIDEGFATELYYQDLDGDAFGDPGVSIESCLSQDGYVTDSTDCDDADSGIYPGAAERCNQLDDDCDGQIPVDEVEDADKDGSLACDDCNEEDPEISPLAPELCNGVDDDCDGLEDDGFLEGSEDTDGDGVKDCLDDCPAWVDAAADDTSDGTWAAPYPSIHAAIDAYEANPVCRYIRVWPGEYPGPVDFRGFPLVIEATSEPEPVNLLRDPIQAEPSEEGVAVIDALGEGPAVSFVGGESAETVLRGFVIRGGVSSGCGGGVFVDAGSPTIERNYIYANVADSGAGICVSEGGSPEIVDNDIVENTASSEGGALWAGNSVEAVVAGNRIVGNTATDGGGIYHVQWDESSIGASIYDNALYENEATGDGGGMFVMGYVLEPLSSNTMVGNQATSGGGIYLDAPSDTIQSVVGSRFEENVAVSDGGGVFVTGPGGVVIEDTFMGSGDAIRGAGLYVESFSTLVCESVTVDSNGASDAELGGGLFLSSSASMTFRDGDVAGNQANDKGGGVYVSTKALVTIENSTIRGNAARYGAGLYADAPERLELVPNDSGELEVSGNTASSTGGGLYLLDFVLADGAEGTLRDCRITENVAANGAGVVLDNCAGLRMISTSIRYNEAAGTGTAGGVLCQGEFLYTIPGGNLIANNTPLDTVGCP